MSFGSSCPRVLGVRGPASLLFLLAATGCPGPEPATTSGEGGGSSTTSAGSTGAVTGPGTSGASTGVGGGAGVGGAGGDGSTTSSGGSAPAGTGGHGGAGVGGAGGCDESLLDTDPLNCGACGHACSALEAEAVVCEAGRCKQLCKDGFSSIVVPEAPEPDDGCETAWRRVFVSEEPRTLPFEGADAGALGTAAADAICQELGSELGGDWRAWISDGVLPSPRERFLPHDVPYWLLDQTVIAMSFEDVIDGALEAPIHVTETGASLFEVFPQRDTFPVWTATDAFGDLTDRTCEGWGPDENAQLSGDVGVVADYEALGLDPSTWSLHPVPRACFGEGQRLYCFEQ